VARELAVMLAMHQTRVTVDRESDSAGGEHVRVLVTLPPLPFLEGETAARAIARTADALAERFVGLLPLIITDQLNATDPRLELEPDDPRLSIDAGLLAQLELLKRHKGRTWLAGVLLELLELERQTHKRPAQSIDLSDELTAAERLHVARVILEHELDLTGDLRYAREQLQAATELLERIPQL
jgi:hypothetical protein